MNIFHHISRNPVTCTVKSTWPYVHHIWWTTKIIIRVSGALPNLVPFVQFKKPKKHPWRSATFSKVAGWSAKFSKLVKSNTPPWVFVTFFKLYKWYQIAQRTTYASIDNDYVNTIQQTLWFYYMWLFLKYR